MVVIAGVELAVNAEWAFFTGLILIVVELDFLSQIFSQWLGDFIKLGIKEILVYIFHGYQLGCIFWSIDRWGCSCKIWMLWFWISWLEW